MFKKIVIRIGHTGSNQEQHKSDIPAISRFNIIINNSKFINF